MGETFEEARAAAEAIAASRQYIVDKEKVRHGWDGKEYVIDTELAQEVNEFEGECANDYKTRREYVEMWGAFEKDYFAAWLEGCSDYPSLDEIIGQAQFIQKMIDNWFLAVEFGLINAEDGWRGIRYE
jgi:hypothetical protein